MLPQAVSGPSGSGMGYSTMGYTHPPTSMYWSPSSAPGASATTPATTPAANSSGLSRDQYLQLLANPGPVPMPGAQPMPGATPTGTPPPNVLQNFLANNQGKTGAGGYSNQGFFNTLKSLQGGQGA